MSGDDDVQDLLDTHGWAVEHGWKWLAEDLRSQLAEHRDFDDVEELRRSAAVDVDDDTDERTASEAVDDLEDTIQWYHDHGWTQAAENAEARLAELREHARPNQSVDELEDRFGGEVEVDELISTDGGLWDG